MMIGRIRGALLEKQPPYLLVEANGLGYELQAPLSVFYKLPDCQEDVILYTHCVVREDAHLLYGFTSTAERALFRALIKVNGVGPKLALTILSGIDSDAFVQCVHANDWATLVKLPGVGKKTAERLLVEMRDTLAQWPTKPSSSGGLAEQSLTVLPNDATVGNAEQEAISALVTLGYKPQEASRVVTSVYTDGMASAELIRQCLKSMI